VVFDLPCSRQKFRILVVELDREVHVDSALSGRKMFERKRVQ